jgi:nicotinamidase-related amidase
VTARGGLMHRDTSRLLLVDVQRKLIPTIAGYEAVERNGVRLLEACRILEVPVTISEHYPQGLGPTVSPLAAAAGDAPRFEKIEFSCLRNPALAAHLVADARDVILCGLEAHVCVLQTAFDMLAAGRRCFVVADAVGSRTDDNKQAGLQRLEQAGAQIVTTEMVLFEWLERAGTPAFKGVSRLIR